MPPAKKAAAPGPALPMVSLARVKEGTRLVERLFAEKADVFIAAGDDYRARHRAGTSRPLSFQEAAQVAAAMSKQPSVQLAEEVQASELRAYDEPTPQELLFAAGLATAPAFLDAAERFTALIEMPIDVFEEACESGSLDEAIAAGTVEISRLSAMDARQRASRALDHFAREVGTTPGEAWGLLTGTVGKAFTQAMTLLGERMTTTSSSLTGSPPPTDGPDETSSMEPDIGL